MHLDLWLLNRPEPTQGQHSFGNDMSFLVDSNTHMHSWPCQNRNAVQKKFGQRTKACHSTQFGILAADWQARMVQIEQKGDVHHTSSPVHVSLTQMLQRTLSCNYQHFVFHLQQSSSMAFFMSPRICTLRSSSLHCFKGVLDC